MSKGYGAKASQYKNTQVLTASKPQILLMLYEAAIRHTRSAIIAMDKKDVAAKGTAIGKVHDIVNELMNSLDFEAGGQVAKDLERLYVYMAEQLLKANMENHRPSLESVEKILRNLFEGWKVAVQNVAKEQAAAPQQGENAE
ncbi:MAG TPA: flagellar export chaperone FliS [Bdellovibrionota bacterium]|jgi:flagellar protein FliS|nr:flagellar export chaperone FliS [Bdellovibrionota bacterium]